MSRMSLTKRQANYIWYCINSHNGFVEDRGEWRYNLDISEEELDEFQELVQNAINSITAEP